MIGRGYDFRKYAVLYVDDEEQARKYFPKLFGNQLRCLTAGSLAEAKEIIEREGDDLGLVISDQRMPGGTGVELLTWLKEALPSVVRILTTAYADLASAIEAVNSGAVFRYVVKPWEHRDLLGILLRGMEYHLVSRERDALLRDKLSTMQRIVLMDRVRSFAVLAAGLTNRLKNPLVALRTYLQQVPHATTLDPTAVLEQQPWAECWQRAERESQRIIELVQEVVQQTIAPSYQFTPGVDVAALVATVAGEVEERSGVRLALSLHGQLPPICADAAMVERMVRILALSLVQAGLATATLTVSVQGGHQVWGQPALLLTLQGDAVPWPPTALVALFDALRSGSPADRDGGMLAAFFIAYHHAGNLTVDRDPAAPAQLRVHLPLDPRTVSALPLERDWLDSLFAFPEG